MKLPQEYISRLLAITLLFKPCHLTVRAAEAGLKVTTVESLWEDDAASAAHEVDAASAAKRA